MIMADLEWFYEAAATKLFWIDTRNPVGASRGSTGLYTRSFRTVRTGVRHRTATCWANCSSSA